MSQRALIRFTRRKEKEHCVNMKQSTVLDETITTEQIGDHRKML